MMLMISGLSGAGKSTALHALEDLDFFCTDNLPLEMLADWEAQMQARKKPAAVCIDARSCADPGELQRALQSVLSSSADWRLLFVDASDEVLQRRFSVLRRRHLFANKDNLLHAIQSEREALAPMRELADLVLDSSSLNPYELADLVESFWDLQIEQQREMTCSLISFSYRRGVPRDADMVMDVRFLPNPHYKPELAALTGKDTPVQAFLQKYPEVEEAECILRRWLAFAWPHLGKERKRYFTLAVGCSGGRHRSVYIVERLAQWMHQQNMANPVIQHRELGPPADEMVERQSG
ncbi:MAG: RNase adapter RapZ [Mariprofundaceae bacterium]